MKTIYYILAINFLILSFFQPIGNCQEEYYSPDARQRQVATDLTNYINKDTKLKGGFLIVNPADKKALNLKFDRVEEIYEIDYRNFVAEVSFKDTEGNRKVLEFSLTHTRAGWEVTNISVKN